MLLEWGNGDRMGNTPSYTPEERSFLISLMTHDRRVNARETPISDHALDIPTKVIRVSQSSEAVVKGTALNKSNFTWIRNSPLGVKVGARVYEQISQDV